MRILVALLLVLSAAADVIAPPDVAIWKLIRHRLSSEDAAEFFQTYVKDALIPGGAGGARALKGTVVSEEPSLLVLAMYDSKGPEVTLKISPPPKTAFPVGTLVRFQGVATEFTKEPFMLTFEIDQDGTTFVEKESK